MSIMKIQIPEITTFSLVKVVWETLTESKSKSIFQMVSKNSWSYFFSRLNLLTSLVRLFKYVNERALYKEC